MGEMSVAAARKEFNPSGRYLNTASIGIPPRSCLEAFQRATEQWGRGELAAPDFDPFVASARRSFSRLIGVPEDCVAIAAAVSEFVGMVAGSLPTGSEVVCAEEDFTSVLFPFLARQQLGELSVRVVPLDRVVESIRPGTAMVALSAVQSADGRVFDHAGLREAARRHGATTLIDATQAVGWLPLAWSDFDFVAVAGYKWLLSPRGTAFLYVRPERLAQLRPNAAGWYAGEDVWNSIYGPPLRLARTARRLDVSPAWLSWVGCAASLEFLEKVGVERIHEHNVRIASLFSERVLGRRCESAIVAVPGDAHFGRLRAKGIAVSRRAGGTRISFHLYNSEDDATAAADALSRV